jgi:hypothetical protein
MSELRGFSGEMMNHTNLFWLRAGVLLVFLVLVLILAQVSGKLSALHHRSVACMFLHLVFSSF